MDSSHIRRRGQDEEENPEHAAREKARIAANTAKFEATAATSSPTSAGRATPLQWKGYGWRFLRGFSEAPTQPLEIPPLAGLAEDAIPEGWRKWASEGVKRRSCKVMCVLFVFVALGLIALVFAFSTTYAWVVSRDPCEVSRDTAKFLKNHPRVSTHEFSPTLPKIIHQQWKTPEIPEGVYKKWSDEFKRIYPEPEYTHMLWTDENARELIATHFSFFLPAYDSYEFGIQRADSARYFVLYMYGGLYADLDYEPLRDFWEHLPTDRVALVESPYLYNEKSQNSLMSSPARDPFWNETFTLLMERKDKPVLQATGPMFLDALMNRATESFTLLPCENFQRLPLHLSAEEEVSPFMSQLHREVLGRMAPMKYCGNYHSSECQYAKHHNTASYLPETGVLKLLWT